MPLPFFFNSLADADAMAAQLPLPAYTAGNDAQRLQWLVAASLRINGSQRWQGRKYDPDQPLEFPRVPYPDNIGYGSPLGYCGGGGGTPRHRPRVWDWDIGSNLAVVPQDVQLATLYEADSMGAGERDRITAAINSGLTMQQTGSLIEQYRQDASQISPLCDTANHLLSKYRLKTGAIR